MYQQPVEDTCPFDAWVPSFGERVASEPWEDEHCGIKDDVESDKEVDSEA
jgi:hypothetical protein